MPSDSNHPTATTTDLGSQETLARAMEDQGRFTESETLLRAVLSARVDTLASHQADVIRAKNNLAACLNAQRKDLVYAESLQLDVVAADRELHGPEHPDVLSGLNNLAHIYAHQGRYGKAIDIQREILALNEKIHGPTHEDTLRYKENLANSLTRQGQLLGSESTRMVVEEFAKAPSTDDARDAGSRNDLASVLCRAGQYDEAERIYREFIAQGSISSLAKLSATSKLGGVLRDRGNIAQATTIYEEALALAEEIAGVVERQTKEVEENLGVMGK
ncbi:hypothetical protein LTR27_012092 [Elasticomyces elasticus]|nr:hypothetical protein LTR27_012092 [Elasticomyces elasticus]